MKIEIQKYVLPAHAETAVYRQVEALAERLLGDLNEPQTISRIAEANQPGNHSSKVQNAFLEFARAMGFESEKKGLFKDSGLALRPDYFLPIANTGILLEVERGKTTINNMDLLDFWKCHLCGVANHLFLLVPIALRQNHEMRPKNEFVYVSRRLSQFFEPVKATNVHSLCLFGY